jgi:hypothetical protein
LLTVLRFNDLKNWRPSWKPASSLSPLATTLLKGESFVVHVSMKLMSLMNILFHLVMIIFKFLN